MRINKIIPDSRANGPGVRYTIWVQGCSIRCRGCFNTDTWPINDGYEMSVDEIMRDIKQTPVGAVSLTGGEPLDQYDEVIELLGHLSTHYNSREIDEDAIGYHVLLTTGYDYTHVIEKFPRIPHHVDILIDGPFMVDKIDKTSNWRGSTNQGIHFLTKRSIKDWELLEGLMQEKSVDAEVRVSLEGDAVITGFAIPESFIPKNKKPKSRYQIAKDSSDDTIHSDVPVL